MRFSQSTHLLMFLSLQTLTFIIMTDLPILVELIDLVNSVIISNDLTQMVNSPTPIQDGIDVYIPHRKYQVKPHSSPWFSAACAAAIAHRNHFFRFCQKDKSSASKVNFRQASNCCKRVLEAAKLAYANKTKESITSQKLGSRDFW